EQGQPVLGEADPLGAGSRVLSAARDRPRLAHPRLRYPARLLRLRPGFRRRRPVPRWVRRRGVRREPAGSDAPRGGFALSLRTPLRPGRGDLRRRAAGSRLRERRPAAAVGAPHPGAGDRRRAARRGPLGVRRARDRVDLRGGRAADSWRARATRGHPALGDPVAAERRAPAVRPDPQRARALRSAAGDRRTGGGRRSPAGGDRARPAGRRCGAVGRADSRHGVRPRRRGQRLGGARRGRRDERPRRRRAGRHDGRGRRQGRSARRAGGRVRRAQRRRRAARRRARPAGAAVRAGGGAGGRRLGRGARLPGERAVRRAGRAGGCDVDGVVAGRVRARARATVDDRLPRRRAVGELGRAGRGRVRAGADDGVRLDDRRRAARGLRGAQRGRAARAGGDRRGVGLHRSVRLL
ncbi:MAG: putative serine protease, partial [uncultured Solirubrobacteraceae bacterium]